jgi:hypothetical protein
MPGLHRIRKLRQRIGVDERPFTPIPKRQRRHLRYHRIVDEIRELEAKLVGHLGEINRMLDRRARLRGILPKFRSSFLAKLDRSYYKWTPVQM